MVLASCERQLQAAIRSRARAEALLGRPVLTEVRRLDRFYLAEDYHQKHALRRDRLLSAEVAAHCPTPAGYRESTLAARLNGFVHGLGSVLQLDLEIGSYGLTSPAEEHLRTLVTRR